MKKGGYKIVDFKGTALSGTATELPGIYNQIVDEYDKPIMVSGVSLNGELKDDAYASVKVSDGSVELTVYGGIITVTEDNEVTFASSSSVEELTEEIGDLDDLQTTDKDSVVNAINSVKNESIKATGLTPFSFDSVTADTEVLVGQLSTLIPSGTQFVSATLMGAGGSNYTDWNATIFVVGSDLKLHPTKTQNNFTANINFLYI